MYKHLSCAAFKIKLTTGSGNAGTCEKLHDRSRIRLRQKAGMCASALRRRSAEARLLRLWVRIPLGTWIFVCYECCVLSGRGLCDELIPRPEESYRLWCVVVCDLETLWIWMVLAHAGLSRQKQTNRAQVQKWIAPPALTRRKYTRNISYGSRRVVRRAENLTTFMCRLTWNLRASTSCNPSGPVQACTGFALPLPVPFMALSMLALRAVIAFLCFFYIAIISTNNAKYIIFILTIFIL